MHTAERPALWTLTGSDTRPKRSAGCTRGGRVVMEMSYEAGFPQQIKEIKKTHTYIFMCMYICVYMYIYIYTINRLRKYMRLNEM